MNQTPSELYQAGRLDEALQRSLSLVKNHPAQSDLRFQLAEFACIAGDLERAERQLETVANQDPQAALGAALFRQLVRAELSRRECYHAGRMPEFIGEPSLQLQNHVHALTSLRLGNTAEAAEFLDSIPEVCSGETASKRSWIVNGSAAAELRDLDDVLAPILEVHTSTGKYFWIHWDQIVSLQVHPPKRPIDLLWRQASLSIESGPDGEVYLPAIYVDAVDTPLADASLRLGRSTDWLEVGDEIVRGRGQKTLLVGDSDLPLMQLVTIERLE